MATLAHTTRRNLFAIATAAALLPGAALALPPATDADLAALGEEYDRAVKAADDAANHALAAFERFKATRPKAPDELIIKASHARSHGGPLWDNISKPLTAANAVWLEKWLGRTDLRSAGVDREISARRLLAAFEQHEASDDRALTASGYEKACDEEDRRTLKRDAIERRILDARFTTLRGAAVKAKVALRNLDNNVGQEASEQVARFVIQQAAN